MKRGLIIGKFMPLHKGHELLINFAAESGLVERLDVLVCSQTSEPWWEYRYKWMIEYTNSMRWETKVHPKHLHKNMPQLPEDDPDFWNKWKAEIDRIGTYDYVFASEPYGKELAEKLNAKFIPSPEGRSLIDISGTKLRQSVKDNFSMLSKGPKADLNFKIAIFGPESSGKTTAAKALAKLLDGAYFPEYARSYLDVYGPEYKDEMLPEILAGNKAQYHLAGTSDKFFNIFDTDSLTTRIWCDFLKEKEFDLELCNKYIEQEVYDLTFLMADDIPFVKDPLRYGGDKRQLDVDHFKKYLDLYGRQYKLITGEDEMDRLLLMESVVRESVGKTLL